MKQNEMMYPPISFEHLLSNLFGKLEYHGYVIGTSKSRWRKDLIKILTFIKKAVEINVNTDGFHYNQLTETCDDFVKRIKEAETINTINAEMIHGLIILVFRLLGDMPNHWDSRAPSVYTDKSWYLHMTRTLQYQQTSIQRAHFVINLVDRGKTFDCKPKGFYNLYDVFRRGFKKKPQPFLSWFKREYPEIYCQIF